MKFLVLIF